jgi:hypothetical protein
VTSREFAFGTEAWRGQRIRGGRNGVQCTTPTNMDSLVDTLACLTALSLMITKQEVLWCSQKTQRLDWVVE